MNQTIEQYLHYYLNYKQDNWVSLLLIAQLVYNNIAIAMGILLFFVNYGIYLRILGKPKGIKLIVEKAKTIVTNIKKLYD